MPHQEAGEVFARGYDAPAHDVACQSHEVNLDLGATLGAAEHRNLGAGDIHAQPRSPCVDHETVLALAEEPVRRWYIQDELPRAQRDEPYIMLPHN